MQITLNTNEVSDCVLSYVKDQLGLDDTNNFVVELHEDGITVHVNEDQQEQSSTTQTPTSERPPKKPRRTKAQIEADNKAEAARLVKTTEAGANGSDTSGNAVASTQQAVVETQVVQAEAAGVTTQEPSDPGTEPEVGPSNAVGATVVVEQPAEEPVIETPAETPATVEEPAAEEPVTPKPTTSLFANLRKPNNQ